MLRFIQQSPLAQAIALVLIILALSMPFKNRSITTDGAETTALEIR